MRAAAGPHGGEWRYVSVALGYHTPSYHALVTMPLVTMPALRAAAGPHGREWRYVSVALCYHALSYHVFSYHACAACCCWTPLIYIYIIIL